MNTENEEQLKLWYKKFLFANPVPSPRAGQLSPELLGAILGYMLRNLGHGRIPDVAVVEQALEGKATIGSCGYLNCPLDYEHVH